jgi:hypothetical protein
MATRAASRAATLAHQRTMVALSERVATAAGRAWDSLATVEDAGPLVNTLVPLMTSARRAAIVASVGYMRTYSQAEQGKALTRLNNIDVDEVLGKIRNGADMDDVYQRGVITARRMLGEGAQWSAAMAAGRARTIQAARADIALANRTALTAVNESVGSAVTRWVRVPDGESCGFCAEAAGWTYSDPEQSPLHPGCGCTLEPVLEGESSQLSVPRTSVDEDNASEAAAVEDGEADYTIHDHGELGAVAYPAGQSFEDA